jgi:alpha-2-macroglobulin
MDRYGLRRGWLPLLLVASCGEREETAPPPLEPTVTHEEVAAPPVDPGAERANDKRAALQRLETSKKALDPKLTAAALMETAESAQKQQNFKEARDAYRALVLLHTDHEKAPESLNRSVLASFRLGEYSDGLQFFEDAIHLFDGTIAEARLLRVLGNTYLSIPHWGVKKGGELIRARWDQGIYQDTTRLDRTLGISRLEEARTIYLAPEHASLAKERIEAEFDLVSALARFTPYDRSWYYWYYAWPEAEEDDRVEAEGADEQVDQWAERGRLQRAEPRGLPVDPDGKPIFETKPETYSGSTVQKIKFVLDEIRKIDPTPNKEFAATSMLRQALIFQTRDGTDRLQRFAGWWWNGAYPYKAAVEEKKLWELADDEVYGLIATHLGVYRPPEDENAFALFKKTIAEYPETPAADQAAIAIGTHYQTRQQYDRALASYREYLAKRPKGGFRAQAEGSIRELTRPEVRLEGGGVQLPGSPLMALQHRNTTTVAGRARKLDMRAIVAFFKKEWQRTEYAYVEIDLESLQHYFTWDEKRIDRFAAGKWQSFELGVLDDKTMRYSKTDVRIPIEGDGLWVVEAKPSGENTSASRALVMMQTMAVVAKTTPQGELIWVVDAKTGVPIANAAVEVFEYWNEWKSDSGKSIQLHRIQNAKTDERGMANVSKLQGHQHLISVESGKQFAYAGNGYYWYYGPTSLERGDVGLVFTDRPVYRPENEAKMRVWARHRRDGKYLDASVKTLTLRIHDPKGAQVLEKSLSADEHGGADFTYSIPKGAPLGLYRMDVRADGSWLQSGGNQFRVEEYKAPEFEVKVSVGDGPAKLGAKIPIEISADYYFGGAVEGARVRYQIFRTDHHREFVPRGRWDWLYGEGYGLCWYGYPWFAWWDRWGTRPYVWYPWWGARPEPKRELVEEGEGVFGHDGKLKVELDTKAIAENFGDTDQRFVVKAEVRDASRRTINGEGEVIATRNQFFTAIETDAGYYRTGETMKLTVRTMRPDQAPFKVEGELRIAKVLFTGDNLDVVEEKTVVTIKKSTDDFGVLEQRFDVKEDGQYRISFVAKDAWGGEVTGSALVWAWGPGFDGRRFKFNHLEVVTDRRSYAIGETARLLISSDVAGAHVLFSAKGDNGAIYDPQVLRLEGKTKVVEIPITASHVPNFFVDATLVGAGKISEEIREVFVPPADAELKVEVKPKKKEYRPGEKAALEVVTTTLDGRPLSANVAVSVLDAAVLYIQPSMTPEVRQFFWGMKRTHQLISRSNLKRLFPNPQSLNRPDWNAISIIGSWAQGWLQGAVDFERALGDDGVAVGGAGNLAVAETKAELRADAKTPASVAAPAPQQEGLLGKKDAAKRQRAAGKEGGARDEAEEQDADKSGEVMQAQLVTPDVRKNFADTAAWRVVTTNDAGRAEIDWTFPDNLTTWKVKAIGIGRGTRVGEASAETVTTKNLLVRLQSPRFFRERDRVVLTANVHNRLASKKKVKVELAVTESLLVPEGERSKWVEVPAGGEARVDFWVNVKGEGEATVRMSALSDEESDAKELKFPVLVHGMLKTESQVGSMTAKGDGTEEKSLVVRVPEERRPEQTELVVRWSPTLAGAMLDALPYLLEYPYGCTEQTTSRFVPAVITKKALQMSGGFSLEDLKKRTKSANPQHVDESKEAYEKRLEHMYRAFDKSPVYSQAVMDDMIRVGLERLRKMQKGDGGWGWWGGDSSSIYTTAYVLFGLHEAAAADVAVPGDMIARGRQAMLSMVPSHLTHYREHEWVSDEDAFFAYVMSLSGEKNEELNKFLMERRVKLSVYGKSLFALALWNLKDKDGANLLLRNAAQFLKEDPENETAWLETRNEGWWYWYNSDIESNAFFLRALSAIRPDDPRAGKVVKWLLNHRQNGWYWRSTRDTAIVIASFAAYMRANRFDKTNYDLEVLVDGKLMKTVHLDASNLLTFDGELRLKGSEVSSGEHTITFRKKGVGAVYFNSYLTYFTLEEDVPPAGLEIKVERKYFKLVRDDKENTLFGQRGQAVQAKEMAYRKVPLASGDRVDSGDLILVELMLESKNDYEFLAFEDPKPAGAEPVALRSGHVYGEAVANMELRDDKVVFFLSHLNQGKLKLDYRLRAEIPGTFHAMPTYGFAMYSPELRCNSSEMRFEIRDQP